MILPTKGLRPEMTLLTIGAEILDQLEQERPLSEVWDRVRAARRKIMPSRILSFDWFVLSLSLLYALSVVEFRNGILRRAA